MLWTKELKETIEFYTGVLGFEFYQLNEEWGWASVEMESIHIMFAVPPDKESFDKPSFTGSLYLRCDNVDEIWGRVKNRARIRYPIENFEYGMREFAVYDNNGYLLQFGQEIE